MYNNWDGIFGHRHNREVLDRIIDTSKIPHALLFVGKKGIGKDFFAIRFAQLINKRFCPPGLFKKVESGIANLSEPYIKFIFALPRGKNELDDTGPYEKLTSDELVEIKNELNKKIENPYYRVSLEKANNIKVSSIRDIHKFLSLEFDPSYYRFVMISDAHLMNETSQNALLKNLEEPPDRVVFILTTSFPDLLRETIRSRCWSLYFNPLNNEDISNILTTYFDIEKVLANEVSFFSDGSVETANQLIEHDFKLLKDKTIKFLRYALGKKFHAAYSEIQDLISGDSYNLKLLIQMIITWLNDLQKHKLVSKNFFYSDYMDTLEKFNIRFPKSNIHDVAFNLDKLSSLVENNINPNLITMNLIYGVSNLTK
jgi:DNA polymerase III delta prime subunit